MKYSYKNNTYDGEIKWILIVTGFPAIILMINHIKIGSYIGLIGAVTATAINIFSIYKSKFSFMIDKNALKVIYHKKIIDFLWSDIDNIDEDERGLIIKISKRNIEFPVLNDMKRYEDFKTEVSRKAFEYQIPITQIKEN